MKDEEHLVVSLQRYVNTGLLDDHGVLADMFYDNDLLTQSVADLTSVLRPWLRMAA